MTSKNKKFDRVAQVGNKVVAEVEKAIIGKRELLEKVMVAVYSSGHILLEDFPGLGKTLLAKSFSTALGLDFKRIQFTPDLLPTDITGGYVFNRAKNSFELRKGPVFANVILADEINRASPKTQSALLEAMQEKQVTIEGETMKLPEPFIVIATQNPIEYEGTFPLPEAQLDRFMVKLAVGYPSIEEEQQIIHQRHTRQKDGFSLEKVTDKKELLELQGAVEDVFIDPDIERYIVELVNKTRTHNQVAIGASPRGSLALLKLTRAHAALNQRDFVLPDDIKHYAVPALGHRMILKTELWLKLNAANEIIANILTALPVPVIEGI